MSKSNNYLSLKSNTDDNSDLEGGRYEETHIPSENDYNCFLKLVIKMFKKMYPAEKKEVPTVQG